MSASDFTRGGPVSDEASSRNLHHHGARLQHAAAAGLNDPFNVAGHEGPEANAWVVDFVIGWLGRNSDIEISPGASIKVSQPSAIGG